MAWGTGLFTFFNDSYRPIHSGRFKGLMGEAAADLWWDVWADLEPAVKKAFAGEGVIYENMLLTMVRGSIRQKTWWNLCFTPFFNEAGEVVGIYCVPTETTDKVLASEREALALATQTFLVELNQALYAVNDPTILSAITAEKLGQFLQADCVGYEQIELLTQLGHVDQDWTRGNFPSMVGTHRISDMGPKFLEQLRSGQTVVVNDTATDPLTVGTRYRQPRQGVGNAGQQQHVCQQARLASPVGVPCPLSLSLTGSTCTDLLQLR